MANTAEELFKAASQVLEQQAWAPVVLAKLAERGYKASTEEEAGELLKTAASIRDAVASGKVAPIPARALDEKGGLSKAASVQFEQDAMAFAPEINPLDLDKVEEQVKEAAAVLTWGCMEQMVAEAAKTEKK